MIRFVEPAFLALLLLVVPYLLLLRRVGRAARGRRGAISLILRGIALALLVAALARPQLLDQVDDLAVAFVVDVSESVPGPDRDHALRQIQDDMERMPPSDQAGLVVFGDRPSVELPFGGPRATDLAEGMTARLDHLESRVDRGRSDLSRAVEFAAGILPSGVARRVVLVSDGNQTEGDLMAGARELAAAGVRLDVRPIRYLFDREVMVLGLQAAPRGRVDEPILLRALVSAQTACEALLELRVDGELAADPYPVHLDRGTNIFRFSPIAKHAGVHQFELTLRSEVDGNQSNNVGRAGVVIDGNASAWVVSAADQEDRITEVLVAGGMDARALDPRVLPSDPAGYFLVDTVVLNNLPAFDLTPEQLAALRDAVRELGVGLVVIGGDQAYGPGGYRGTALADLLPVDLDTTNKKTMPKGALVIVLHSVEFDSGNTWAVKICKAAIGGMNPTDEAGIVLLGNRGGAEWLFDLQPVGDGAAMGRLIDTCYPGDMQTFADCFELTETSLSASDAAVKHVVVISDGDPQAPAASVMHRLVGAKVTVSTVCINPHGPGSEANMNLLASTGGGRFYRLYPGRGDLQRLPSLMLKEAATLRRATLSEDPFVPWVLLPESPILRGVGAAVPQLLGYCITSVRGGAETILLANDQQNDPLLASWHAGLGRVVAFTSSLDTRWAKEWLGWDRFAPLVQQMVRASVLDFDESTYPVEVVAEGMRLRVEMSAKDADGSPATGLEVIGTGVGSGASPISFTLGQRDAGRYTGFVDMPGPGHYVLQLRFDQDGRSHRVLTAAAIDYAPEYRAERSREDVLRAAADATGGRSLADGDDPFAHDFQAVVGRIELWPWALLLAAVFLVFDVGVRRLDLFRAEGLRRWLSSRATRRVATRAARASSPGSSESPVASASKSVPSGEGTPSTSGSVDEGGSPAAHPKTPPSPGTAAAEKRTLDELKRAKERGQDRREWK